MKQCYCVHYLQHIHETHLGSDLNGEFEPNRNLPYIRIFTVVGFLILVVACINFMILAMGLEMVEGFAYRIEIQV